MFLKSLAGYRQETELGVVLLCTNIIGTVQLEGHSSSGCSTPARYSDMHCSNSSQTLLQCFDDAVITFENMCSTSSSI